MPLGVVREELLTETGCGPTKSEATREAAILERGAMFGGVCNGAAGAGNVERAGAAKWRCAASCVLKLDKSTSEPSLGSWRGLHCALLDGYKTIHTSLINSWHTTNRTVMLVEIPEGSGIDCSTILALLYASFY